jgi:hypothetical protein
MKHTTRSFHGLDELFSFSNIGLRDFMHHAVPVQSNHVLWATGPFLDLTTKNTVFTVTQCLTTLFLAV